MNWQGANAFSRAAAAGARRSPPKILSTRPYSTTGFSAGAPSRRTSALGGWLWAVPVTTFCLGCWQVQRLQWKLDLMKRAEDKLHLPAVDLPKDERPVFDRAEEFRRVKVSGTFHHDKEMLLGPRTRKDQQNQGGGIVSSGASAGYYVITPFERAGTGEKILVNRGWIPRDQKEKSKRRAGLVTGVVTIEGLLRAPEKGGMFIPDNKPEKNEWYWLDMDTMTKHTGALPVVIEMVSDSAINAKFDKEGFPLSRTAFLNFKNDHLQYAITWYGLCIASTAMIIGSRRAAARNWSRR
ncbi:SURF1 family-domain-containing protein [Fimicolochytrium jonesii]|uniref:SURF1 family-domain-containing protein n=1 Tax=Fimicolochytrium jonesii TaxID=1396493 RepID=UPI0022FDB8E1|nr:SURF1 family-domain-containing protein [Fimicolochytrium jonesii]KAI8821111.1 SURF1 family-domain-containing protein [Fimicolochytrium jonesii]